MLHGIDVSAWQPGDITANVEYDFAIIKATGGTGYVSGRCNEQVSHAVKRGKLIGLYHFANDGFSPASARDEADFFVDNIEGHLKHDPVLVLDFEHPATQHYGPEWCREWLNRVYERTGIKPMFYSYANYVQSNNLTRITSGDYGLWIASYGNGNRTRYDDCPSSTPRTGSWEFAAMYQFTSSGRLAGYAGDLDLNRFYGDRAAWLNYAGVADGEKPSPAPAPAPPAPSPRPPARSHRVRAGDTLSGIGARYGVSWREIAALNGLSNPDLIFPDQILKIPGVGDSGRSVVVQAGDTLSAIGERVGVNWRTLAEINQLSHPDIIYPGQVIRY